MNENGACSTTLLSHIELSYINYKGGQNVPNFRECPMFQKTTSNEQIKVAPSTSHPPKQTLGALGN
jgi:hypothetical protein